MHISSLFEIPSTLKTQEYKMKDKCFKLGGSLMAGNNSPKTFKKIIKMILIKLKNNKMISVSEFNEILNIFLEILNILFIFFTF